MGILAHQTERTDRADRRTRVPSARHRWLPATLAALATLTALTLALAGCGQVITHPGTVASGTPKPQATSTPTPIQLKWQAATAPTGGYASVYAPAPSDGNIAYACGMAGSSQSAAVILWSTQDRGATWSSAVTQAVTLPARSGGCILRVDATDPQTLTVTIQASDGSEPPLSMLPAFISNDGGKTWQALPQAGPRLPSSLASYHGVLYATGDGPSASGETQSMWVSSNGGHSWTARTAPHLPSNPTIWLNPQNGDLLGAGDSGAGIYRSTDGGATWTPIPLPSTVPTSSSFIAAPDGSGWHICAAIQTTNGTNTTNSLTCSDNLGVTWAQRPGLNPAELSPKGFTFTAPVDVYAITSGGALLAWYDDPNADIQIAALAPGASTWTPIVAAESDGTFVNAGTAAITLTYTPTPGDGLLWVASGTQTPPFFTATYP